MHSLRHLPPSLWFFRDGSGAPPRPLTKCSTHFPSRDGGREDAETEGVSYGRGAIAALRVLIEAEGKGPASPPREGASPSKASRDSKRLFDSRLSLIRKRPTNSINPPPTRRMWERPKGEILWGGIRTRSCHCCETAYSDYRQIPAGGVVCPTEQDVGNRNCIGRAKQKNERRKSGPGPVVFQHFAGRMRNATTAKAMRTEMHSGDRVDFDLPPRHTHLSALPHALFSWAPPGWRALSSCPRLSLLGADRGYASCTRAHTGEPPIAVKPFGSRCTMQQ